MGRDVRVPVEREPEALLDPVEAAKAARLRYVSDATPGIRREKKGDEFIYVDPDGKRVRDEETLKRIRSLAIPPAWSDVWICPSDRGHLQATGRDAKGRKQYRYHPRWREVRDESKYGRMISFGQALPTIRQRIEEDLARPGLPREKVLATAMRLLELTLIRVGNEEYARTNHHYGLTTLRDRHVDVEGGRVRFHFQGKSGVRHAVGVTDRRLARIVKGCRDIPGQDLFQYYEADGSHRSISSGDVNDYLREIAGEEFTAKDFRTWAGTLLAAAALCECGECESESERKQRVVDAVKRVSEKLGNTPSVCRKCYIHPAVIDAYLDGTFVERMAIAGSKKGALHDEEERLLEFLNRGQRTEDGGRRKREE